MIRCPLQNPWDQLRKASPSVSEGALPNLDTDTIGEFYEDNEIEIVGNRWFEYCLLVCAARS